MAMEELIGSEELASPIEQDAASISEINTTQLSLPDSFDESLCLDLYKEFKGQGRHEYSSDALLPKARAHVGHNSDEPLERIPHHHDELEFKVRGLLSANLELKEKGRLYDSLKKRSTENEAAIEELRSQMQHQISLHDSSIVREKELKHQVLEYKRKVHLIGIDLEHARKESEVFLGRAEKAENGYEASVSALRSTQQKYENTLSQLTDVREEAKSCIEREIARIREESNNEIISSRSHQKEAFVRESKLLCGARDQAIEHAKLLREELRELRTERETKEAENLDIVRELERQLADTRSDLKVKLCEQNTLRACQDRTTAEVDQWKEESDRHKRDLAQLQQEYTNLKCQASKLEEAIRQKDDALELYHHDDLLVGYDTGSPEPNGAGYFSPGGISLAKNSVALARKCRELQSLLKRKDSELDSERKRNEALSRKEESSQRLFRELTAQNSRNASAYIISAVRTRDNEISKMSSRINLLETNLEKTARERDELTSKLSQILERRERLDEMKELVESMRRAGIDSMSSRVNAQHAGRADDDKDMDDEGDMSDHIVHCRAQNSKR